MSDVKVDYWLAEVGPYGYATALIDGPHCDRSGVEQALYLIRSLGLERGRSFCCARVEQSAVIAVAHSVNEEALSACRLRMRGTAE